MYSEGVLSDDSGELVIKPCTAAEVDFYEKVTSSHPDLAFFLPAYMGTLRLGDQTPSVLPGASSGRANAEAVADTTKLDPPVSHYPSSSIPPGSTSTPSDVAELRPVAQTTTHAPSSSIPGAASTERLNASGPLKGKKLDTDLHIVLENATAGFVQPNIMDLKLGAQLWDDDAKPEKRARLDKVASETTSGSLGFRIAGMRVWQGPRKGMGVEKLEDVVKGIGAEGAGQHWQLDDATNHRNYNKYYGRSFTADSVIEGFRQYLLVPSAGVGKEQAVKIAANILQDIQEIQEVLEHTESRMYSASILLVYEGDPRAFEKAVEAQKAARDAIANEEDEDEDDEDEAEPPKFFAVKLIDFAHAHFEKGIGPDENMLQGVRSTVRIFEKLIKELSA